MRNFKSLVKSIPQGLKPRLHAAAAVALVAGIGAAAAFPEVARAGERVVDGQFNYVGQLPLVCGPLSLLCSKGSFTGGIEGTFVNTITTLVPSSLVLAQVDFFTGHITIKTSQGNLVCNLAGALQNTGDGEFGEICVITGGTGTYADATGHLELIGESTPALPPFFKLRGAGTYIGKVVAPGIVN